MGSSLRRGSPTWESRASLVRGVDQGGNPLLSSSAITQDDGSYVLWDAQYTGGPVTVQASYKGQTLTGNGYEANPQTDAIPALLKFFKNVAIADVTFPPEPEPGPPPVVQIQVMKLVNGQRQDTQGLVAAGTPVLFGIKTNLTVQTASVQVGAAGAAGPRGPRPPHPGSERLQLHCRGLRQLRRLLHPDAAGDLHPGGDGPAGVRTARDADVRVPGDGGRRRGRHRSRPAGGAHGAHATSRRRDGRGPRVLPQLAFSEPVKNVFGNATLSEVDSSGGVAGTVPVTLLGVAPDGQPVTVSGPTSW